MEKTQDKISSTPKPPQRRKIAIVYLVLLLSMVSGALIYMYIQSKELEKRNFMTQEELDQAYVNLDSMSTELDARILQIAQLGGEIDTLILIKNKLEEDKRLFEKKAYNEINDLQGKVQGYKELLLAQDEEIERLKILNAELLTENTGLKSEANELNESIRALNSDRQSLENKVAVASRLKIEGMRIIAISSSVKEREGVFRNRHINELKIQFSILENRVAPIEGKEILVKITAPDGNVIFDVASGSGTFMFENRESFYTAKKDILYDRNDQSLTYLYNKGTDYAIGKYIVEVYTEDYRMGKGSFIVK